MQVPAHGRGGLLARGQAGQVHAQRVPAGGARGRGRDARPVVQGARRGHVRARAAGRGAGVFRGDGRPVRQPHLAPARPYLCRGAGRTPRHLQASWGRARAFPEGRRPRQGRSRRGQPLPVQLHPPAGGVLRGHRATPAGGGRELGRPGRVAVRGGVLPDGPRQVAHVQDHRGRVHVPGIYHGWRPGEGTVVERMWQGACSRAHVACRGLLVDGSVLHGELDICYLLACLHGQVAFAPLRLFTPRPRPPCRTTTTPWRSWRCARRAGSTPRRCRRWIP